MYKRITLFCFVLLLGTSICNAEDLLPNHVRQQIDNLFKVYDKPSSPGYAVGISVGDQTIFQHGYGSANLDYNLSITTKSTFSIASVSKQFTAACLALLILDKEVSLEEPAQNYIPELKKYDETIRIKHLVYNTSGLTDYHRLPRASGKSWITFNYFDIDECIDVSLSQDTLLFDPGKQWDYCNVNFMLLTKIIEQVSGQSFSMFIKKRIFKPLGMTNSMINDDITAVVKNRVTPYNLRTKETIDGYANYGIKLNNEGDYIQHPRMSPHYGGSGVITTIEDLLKWAKSMASKKLGGQPFYDLMHATPAFDHDRTNQAFGLYFGDFNGIKTVSWDGGDWGISSQLLRIPEQGIAIVVLSNLGSGESFRKVNKICEILYNAEMLQ